MSNLNDFWGTPEEPIKFVDKTNVDNDEIDIASPCPICFRSDSTVSTKGKELDKIDVLCKTCKVSYTFYHPAIWQMLGIHE
jgi:transcription elongation factor Elf1